MRARGLGMFCVVALLAAASPEPPDVVYATYVGGKRKDGASAITVDSEGNTYLVGGTPSEDFPVTRGAFRTDNPVKNNDHIGFVTKVGPNGNQLVYSTLLGGVFRTVANTIAVDAEGMAYVGGGTCSINFPTTSGAFQTKALGGMTGLEACDGFLVKLGPAGRRLHYGTYYGGSGADNVTAVTIDDSGTVYLAGYTSSRDLPVTSSATQASLGGDSDGALAVFDATGAKLLHSSYLGGEGQDVLTGVKLGPDGMVYAVGFTASHDFPADGSPRWGPGGSVDGFLVRVNPGRGYQATFLRFGGSANDTVSGLDVDNAGNIYIVGTTWSADFPVTPNTRPRRYAGGRSDGYVVKIQGPRLETGQASVMWSRCLGGADDDALLAVSAGFVGSVFVGGNSSSRDFPVTENAFRPKLERSNDGVFARLGSESARVHFATFAGGDYARSPAKVNDRVTSITATASGRVYLTGSTKTIDHLITPGAAQVRPRGNTEPFVIQLRFR